MLSLRGSRRIRFSAAVPHIRSFSVSLSLLIHAAILPLLQTLIPPRTGAYFSGVLKVCCGSALRTPSSRRCHMYRSGRLSPDGRSKPRQGSVSEICERRRRVSPGRIYHRNTPKGAPCAAFRRFRRTSVRRWHLLRSKSACPAALPPSGLHAFRNRGQKSGSSNSPYAPLRNVSK